MAEKEIKMPTPAYADLEIGLHRRDTDQYTVDLRLNLPNNDADIRLTRGVPPTARFDRQYLLSQEIDHNTYGHTLSTSLFADPNVKTAFQKAMNAAQLLDVPLRVRLLVGESAPELHTLRWETLQNPDTSQLLCTDEHILFSRYMSSDDWRPVNLRSKSELRALIVIANPADLQTYEPGGQPFPPVDVANEAARARNALRGTPILELASAGNATLSNLMKHLRDGYDILYLVSHGALINGEPLLWLENEQGCADIVTGSDLITHLCEVQHRPRLIVLASCQSMGNGSVSQSCDNGVLAALGPRLAQAGIPAVLAMQGNVTIQTVTTFMPIFFEELQRHGQIDRAVAVARGAVRDQLDWWMPVLFMRLKSGRIWWYVPGFANEQQNFEKWPALLSSIQHGCCTPILGFGLVDSIIGSSREIAHRLAEVHHFPLAPHNREDLPQVTQYLTVNQSPFFVRTELEKALREGLLRRYSNDLPPEIRAATPPISLNELINAVGTLRRTNNPAEPHHVLANLPFPLYITTNADNLLTKALEEAGKTPHVSTCPWNEQLNRSSEIFEGTPTPQQPLVYHLFGNLQEPRSLVLTEDDYFNYLIGVTKNESRIPKIVRHRLVDTALLFIGFRMDDWNFRVLFRSLMSAEGHYLRNHYAHVAVQIDPEDPSILQPERVRHYLEAYFKHASISIYWGSAEDFIRELQARIHAVSEREVHAL